MSCIVLPESAEKQKRAENLKKEEQLGVGEDEFEVRTKENLKL